MTDSPLAPISYLRHAAKPYSSSRASTPSPRRSRSRSRRRTPRRSTPRRTPGPRRRTPRRSPARHYHCHDDVIEHHENVIEHHDDVIEHHDHVLHDHHHHHSCPDRKRTWLETLVHLDHTVSARVHAQGLGIFFYVLLRLLEFSGDGMFLIPCAAATFLAPKRKLTPEVRMFFFNLFMTFVFDLIFVSILKKIVRRPRPSYNRGHFLSLQVDHWSFPSGHSTRALITTTLFRLYLPMWRDQARRIWMPFVVKELKEHVIILKGSMYLGESLLISGIACVITFWALATTTSRIILGRHFLCDVLAGSLIGVGEAIFSHKYLLIPLRTCEYVHMVINRQFAWMENGVYKMTSSRNFVVSQVKKK